MVNKWKNLTSREMEELDKSKSIVLLPTGATEQHSAHLPVGTDIIILDSLIDLFCGSYAFDEYSVIFAPSLPIGKSNEHLGFAGTLTFTTKTYYSAIFDIASGIVQSGFNKLVLLNSHGGNYDLLNLISRDLRIELDIEVYVIDWWFTDFWQDGLKNLQESGKYGVFHACELETSLMCYANPELVRMELAVDEEPPEVLQNNDFVSVFGPVNFGWKTADVTRSGVIGSPTFASSEKGRELFAYATEKLARIISEILGINYLRK